MQKVRVVFEHPVVFLREMGILSRRTKKRANYFLQVVQLCAIIITGMTGDMQVYMHYKHKTEYDMVLSKPPVMLELESFHDLQ